MIFHNNHLGGWCSLLFEMMDNGDLPQVELKWSGCFIFRAFVRPKFGRQLSVSILKLDIHLLPWRPWKI